MTDINLIDIHKKLEELISHCYQRYKNIMTDSERETCEMYLYVQGEYEEALTNLVAILEEHKIEIDKKCLGKIEEAKKIMELE